MLVSTLKHQQLCLFLMVSVSWQGIDISTSCPALVPQHRLCRQQKACVAFSCDGMLLQGAQQHCRGTVKSSHVQVSEACAGCSALHQVGTQSAGYKLSCGLSLSRHNGLV